MKVLMDVEIEKRHSDRKNTDYEVVVFTFPNGYPVEAYINSDRKYLIRMACQQSEK